MNRTRLPEARTRTRSERRAIAGRGAGRRRGGPPAPRGDSRHLAPAPPRGDRVRGLRRRQEGPPGARPHRSPGGRRRPRCTSRKPPAGWNSSTPTHWFTTTCRRSTTTCCAGGAPPSTSRLTRRPRSWLATPCSPKGCCCSRVFRPGSRGQLCAPTPLHWWPRRCRPGAWSAVRSTISGHRAQR